MPSERERLVSRANKIRTIDAQKIIQRIEKTNDPALRRELIKKILYTLPHTAHTIPVGHILHRAIKLPEEVRPQHVSRLSYPPVHKVQDFGRCNLPENPVLYLAAHQHNALFEIQPEVGTKFAFSQWQVVREIAAVPLGYSFKERLSMHQNPEHFHSLLADFGRGFDYIQKHFNKWFGHLGNDFYEVTSTLTDTIFEDKMHVEEGLPDYSEFLAIMYRSRRFFEVSGGATADNITLCSASVDAGDVVPIGAQFCQVTQLEGGGIGGQFLSQTTSIDGDILVWE